MHENPYAPPKSVVEDAPLVLDEQTRPSQVVLAVRLAAVNYVFGLAGLVLNWAYLSALSSIPRTIFQQAVSLAVTLWIFYKIYHRRNWARIVHLVLTSLGVLVLLITPVRVLIFAAPTTRKMSLLIAVVINIVILWLLFGSPGRLWFRKR